ncbi:MAG: putative monooxygenase [Marmoricola sp.]|nr:putative monooxygenase [Marmoricola sp.]
MPTITKTRVPHNQVAIIGTGFGGIATAVRLRNAGIRDFVMIDRAHEVGGVWRDNDYPGAAVDVRSRLYSLSFAPNPNWSHTFARRGEIFAYLREVADKEGLRQHLVLGCNVDGADWDEDAQTWRLSTSDGERTAQHLVIATGALADPIIPILPGVEDFRGAAFHSAQWDHSVELEGKKVAVIGTGPSAVQVIPAIQPTVEHLTVFQRTAAWVVPRHDKEISERTKRLFRALPALERLQRLAMYLQHESTHVGFRHPSLMGPPERRARKHLEAQVSDPELREKLTPQFRFGCKRILISDHYLASLDRPNVEVVTDSITRVTENGIIDDAGVEHEVDVIIYGTGFETSRLPLTDKVRDASGQSMVEFWQGSPTAYLGTSVAGFPNAYLIHGPNIGLGHNSVIHMLESQSIYIASAVAYARDHGLASLVPTTAAHRAYADEVDSMSEGTVWTTGGCDSWYLHNGRNSNIWPGTATDFRRRVSRFNPDDHLAHRPAPMLVAR